MFATLLALGPQVLPLIEALLRESPALIADVESIIAAVKGGSPPSPGVDAAKRMEATDDVLKRFA